MNSEEIICDANNLYRAYKVSVKTSKWKETTQKFMMNFLRYIFSIQDDLMNRTLQNGPTQEFTLFERGRVRPITSIQIRDRIIRHVLCDEVLLPEVKKHIIYDNCASIKGRGISHQRDRFEVHLRKYYRLYGNEGWILFGDFSKFQNPSQMLSFAGMEPGYFQSGTSESTGKMVKHGSSFLRYALINCTQTVINYEPTFAQYYAKKRAEGKPYRVALTHTAKKLIRVIFTLQTRNITYDSDSVR